MLNFTKMNGAGNDFVMLDNRDKSLALSQESIARICDRHRGVGADGLLMVEPAENGADFRMRYYNSDGGEAEMCGNGARCFARFVGKLEPGREKISFETMAGVIRAELQGELVELQMSKPHGLKQGIDLEVAGRALQAHFLNTGVPHTVVFVEDLEGTNVLGDGGVIRRHPFFAPAGTNVNFAAVEGQNRIAIRTYERGVEAETLACGTGVVASALIYSRLHNATSPVAVRVRGGETMFVGWSAADEEGGFEGVTLAGPADFVFEGRLQTLP